MSTVLPFTGPVRPISRPIAEAALDEARRSPRRRAILRYHQHEEPIQRMINALEPDSYVRPHRHQDPPKLEIFLALTGAARLVVFDDEGQVIETLKLEAGGPCWGAEILPGTWHSLVAEMPGTVLYELLQGPYQEATHKDFAPWAPPEASPDAEGYLARLRQIWS